ncbi:MAG: PHP domain-containing protein [Candidatus Abyssubacteria bacterium]|nr:PHP domain-containing protein [Candidatus Abyssubacteria bacterium]
MNIDLHCHTYPASSCSNMSIEDLVNKAKELGLGGICLTEHNKPWNREEVQRIGAELGFPVFRGMEVTTKDGDILVFGLHEAVGGVPTASELRRQVVDVGGYMIAAHPFRGFLMFGFSELSLTPERASGRAIFQHVDAIEAYNCKVTRRETEIAFEVAERLGLPCVAGSDAHTVDDVGKFSTRFEKNISSENELIAELAAGRFSIEPLRET